MKPTRRPVTARAARALHPIRNRYSPADTAAKLGIVRDIAVRGLRVRTFAELSDVHGDLLFLRAFPDSDEIFEAAGVALRRIEPALKQLSARQRALADESGITGSVTHYAPSYDIARWLAARWPLQGTSIGRRTKTRPNWIRCCVRCCSVAKRTVSKVARSALASGSI